MRSSKIATFALAAGLQALAVSASPLVQRQAVTVTTVVTRLSTSTVPRASSTTTVTSSSTRPRGPPGGGGPRDMESTSTTSSSSSSSTSTSTTSTSSSTSTRSPSTSSTSTSTTSSSSTTPVFIPSSTSSSSSALPTSTGTPGVDAPAPVLLPGQDLEAPNTWIVYNADEVHYPFTVHLPDRTTRNLPPLDGPPPVLLSLSGSGARGNASEAKILSGYDGASRKIRDYYAGFRNESNLMAAEEFLTITPICPNETAQPDAGWDYTVFPNIIAQVASIYEVDLTRVYASGYSMGARALWGLLMDFPDIFAGSIIGSGRTSLMAYQLEDLLGNSIRYYYGADDEAGIGEAANETLANWQAGLADFESKNTTAPEWWLNRTLENVGPIPGADHLDLTFRPWDDDVLTDGYPGALAWVLSQTRQEGANITYNATVCTDCIPRSPCYPNNCTTNGGFGDAATPAKRSYTAYIV